MKTKYIWLILAFVLVMPLVVNAEVVEGVNVVCHDQKDSIIKHSMICDVTNINPYTIHYAFETRFNTSTVADYDLYLWENVGHVESCRLHNDCTSYNTTLSCLSAWQCNDELEGCYCENLDEWKLCNALYKNGNIADGKCQYEVTNSVVSNYNYEEWVKVPLNFTEFNNHLFSGNKITISSGETKHFKQVANIRPNTFSTNGVHTEGSVSINPTVWFNQTWNYCRVITLNNTNQAGTYQVNLSLNFSSEFNQSKIQQYCQDLRYVDDNATIEYGHWEEQCNLSSNDIAWTWVNITLPVGLTDIFACYGNENATSTSNGTETFYVFFGNDTASTNGWSKTLIDVFINGTYLQFRSQSASISSQNYAERYDLPALDNYVVEYHGRNINHNTNDWWTTVITNDSLTHRTAQLQHPRGSGYQTNWYFVYNDGTWHYQAGGTHTEGTFYIYKVHINESDSASGITIEQDNTDRELLSTLVDYQHSYQSQGESNGLYIGDGTGTASSWIDAQYKFMFYRQEVNNEITYTVGAEINNTPLPPTPELPPPADVFKMIEFYTTIKQTMLSNHDYCYDNLTQAKNLSYVNCITVAGNQTCWSSYDLNFISCPSGCNSDTGKCNSAELNLLIGLLIVIAVILILYFGRKYF